MTFGQAIDRIKDGRQVYRSGWNGKNMFLFYVPVWTYMDGKQGSPFIAMKTAGDDVVPWLASQTDILSDDWEVNN